MSGAPGRSLSFPGLLALATVGALVCFSNREELAWTLGSTMLAGAVGLLLVRWAWRSPGRSDHDPVIQSFVFVLAAAGAVLFSTDREAAGRCLIEWLLVVGLSAAVAHRRALAREWGSLLLLGSSSALCLLLLSWAGPLLLHKWLLPRYTLNLDHRPPPGSAGANEDGVYSPREAEQFRASDENIVFLGDSFTANVWLPHAQRFPTLVEALLRERLRSNDIYGVNFAWVSSSPVLQARQLRAIGAKYAPDLVVQCLDLTDFHDDLRAVAWLHRAGLEPGRITIFDVMQARASFALGVPDLGAWLLDQAWWLPRRGGDAVPRDRWFALRQPWTQSAAQLDVTWRAILETRHVARSLGARFVVFAFPRYQQYDRNESPSDWERRRFPASDQFILEPFKFLEDRARGADFHVHVLLRDFLQAEERPLSFPDDPHWNANGNNVAARAIVHHLVEDGLVRR